MASARELQPTYPYWLAGEAAAPNHDLEVRDKYSNEVATRVLLIGDVPLVPRRSHAVRRREGQRLRA